MYSGNPSKGKSTFELSRDATLLRVSIKVYTGRVKDTESQAELAADKRAVEDRISVSLSRIAKEDRLPIQQIANEARKFLNTVGAVWDDDGYRLIPNTILGKTKAKLQEFADNFDAAVDRLLNRYDELYDKAKQELGGLFSQAGFPSKDEMRTRFEFEIKQNVIPHTGDIRLSHVDSKVKAEIENAVIADQQKKVADIHRQVVDRISEALNRVATQLPRYEAGEIVRFEDSLVGNVLELCDVLPVLNITGDKDVEAVISKAREVFTNVKLDTLRAKDVNLKKVAVGGKVPAARFSLDEISEGTKARKEVVKTASSLLERLQGGAVKAKI